jgi:hypothetical protein
MDEAPGLADAAPAAAVRCATEPAPTDADTAAADVRVADQAAAEPAAAPAKMATPLNTPRGEAVAA